MYNIPQGRATKRALGGASHASINGYVTNGYWQLKVHGV